MRIVDRKKKKESLTSPGQTVNLKLLNRFVISMRDNGLTPLTCNINKIIIQNEHVSQCKGIRNSNIINGDCARN